MNTVKAGRSQRRPWKSRWIARLLRLKGGKNPCEFLSELWQGVLERRGKAGRMTHGIGSEVAMGDR